MQDEHLKILEKVVNMAPDWTKMEPKLAPKSMKNGFQEALNKKDEKWSEKSHARVCGPPRAAPEILGRGGGVP